MALPLLNNAEAQTSGTSVALDGSNTGGTDANAFDAAAIGANMTLTFDNAHAAHGTNAYKIALTSTATAITYLEWAASLGSVTTLGGSFYIWSANLTPPASSVRLVSFRNAGAQVAGFNIASGTGAIELKDAAGATIAGSTSSASNAITASTWMRIEFLYVFNTTSGETARVNVYTGDSTTINTSAFVSSVNQGAACSDYRVGCTTANFSSTSGNAFWLDSFNLNATGLPGPGPYTSGPAPAAPFMETRPLLPRLKKGHRFLGSPFLGFPDINPQEQFPLNGVRDTFNRADANPIDGNWAGPIEAGTSRLKIVSNQATDTGTGSPTYGDDYWTTQFGADQESFATFPVLASGANAQGVWVRVQNPGDAANATGYFAFAVSNTIRLQKLTAGHTYTNLAGAGGVPQTFSAGDGLGLRVVGERITVWYRSGSGPWQLIVNVTDSTITGPGYIGLEVDDTTGRADDFGGGQVPVAVAGDVTVFANAAVALGASPAPAVSVLSINLPALALGSSPAPTVLDTVPATAATGLGVTPAPVEAVSVAPSAALALGTTPASVPVVVVPISAALALGITPTATAVVGGGGVTVPVSSALALGSTPAPVVLVSVPTNAALAAGVTPAPVPVIVKAVTASLALGATPAAVPLITKAVTAALALGSSPASSVLVVVFPSAALALGSTPAPTVISGSGATVTASAALAIGSAPAPAVLVSRTVTAALAAGSAPSPSIAIVRAVNAALALGSAPSPSVITGAFIVAASVSAGDVSTVLVVISEAAGAAVSAQDAQTVTASVTDPQGADVKAEDATGADVRVAELVP